MPMAKVETVMLGREEIFPGMVFDFGPISVSETEIIHFAKSHDPLWLHTDPEAAANGPWKGIIASGPMLFSEFHRRFWIPKFGATVIGGMGIHNWEFFKPHFPDASVKGILSVVEIEIKPGSKTAAVRWDYRFLDVNDELMQSFQYTVLHSTGGFTWINQIEE